ncbi:DUF502 domain-containing protein [Akkermansiaceae bacterium]|jgi:uncharacterized membrane protein|nr:DUF502 domain-containing protein [Akkermansiaceae bacterium]MDB4519282.1 DUF502 domain-containing protein [Akkermansiaceae bacterium]MDB4543283.1 DUF502 domain-containing protein [bacterium]|tara:strand:- start:2607 stop:3326 length:720 start_codon:yes stop_codon:yes gene_type:complete
MSKESVTGETVESKHPRVRQVLKPFLAGMATVIPILATGWIILMVFKLLHRIGLAIIDLVLKGLNFLRGVGDTSPDSWKVEYFPGDAFLPLLIPLVLLFLMGLTVMNRPGKRMVAWIDGAMTRVPLFGFIYSTIKQFVDAVKNLGGPKRFKGVAYVEYPSPGCRMIGFITGHFRDPQTKKDITSVFIPTSPNPMTGFVILIDDDKVFNSDMTLEEAGKMVLSAGLVAPESYEELETYSS